MPSSASIHDTPTSKAPIAPNKTFTALPGSQGSDLVLEKWPHLCGPQLAHLWNGDSNSPLSRVL